MRLDKFVAASGICARRKAKVLISISKIQVNSLFVQEAGYQIQPGDCVTYRGERLQQPNKFIALLLHKPTGYITSCLDEKGRSTILDLLPEFKALRLFPVGRLDRQTSGLLIVTNNGYLAQKLAHPSYQVSKTYEILLGKSLTPQAVTQIQKGTALSDGWLQVDDIQVLNKLATKVRIVLHSGKNRIIRRLFEKLSYPILKLKRVGYGDLKLQNLKRGAYKMLNDREIEKLMQ